MDYPFLRNNQLVLIDYLPGSSGQLLMRLWSELDSTMSYDNDAVLSKTSITKHACTREIDYDILIPKRITNWFIDKCNPTSITDYLNYFEFFGTTLVALSEKWKHGEDSTKFYQDSSYQLCGYRRLYGIHTWHVNLPFFEIEREGYNLKCIRITPLTNRGLEYQFNRCMQCYPLASETWQSCIDSFNSKPSDRSIDFCTMLVDHDTPSILDWLKDMIRDDFRDEKVDRVTEILEIYYRDIVDAVGA